MKRTYSFLLLCFTAFLMQSCGFGYSIHENYTSLNPDQTTVFCDKIPEKVDLLFEGEKIDFDYEKLGMIEVQGDRYANDAELLERLRKLAKSKCCDVILNLKKSYTSRESGFLFSDIPNDHYTAITYFGLAVKKKSSPTVTSVAN